MNKKFLTGLVMTLVALLSSALTAGLPTTGAAWLVLGITALGLIVTYIGKNAIFPSVSVFGTIDLRDVLSGLFMAVGTAVSNFIGAWATGTPMDWKSFGALVLGTVVAYLASKFASTGQTP